MEAYVSRVNLDISGTAFPRIKEKKHFLEEMLRKYIGPVCTNDLAGDETNPLLPLSILSRKTSKHMFLSIHLNILLYKNKIKSYSYVNKANREMLTYVDQTGLGLVCNGGLSRAPQASVRSHEGLM